MEARDERRLLRLQKQLASHKLLIIDELGFVPLANRRRAAVRGVQSALRTRLGDHQQSAVRRMDQRVRLPDAFMMPPFSIAWCVAGEHEVE